MSLSACGNKTFLDTTYTFNKAILTLPTGEVIEGNVQTWNDYEDGDQIQVKIDGTIYLVHSSNVVLISEWYVMFINFGLSEPMEILLEQYIGNTWTIVIVTIIEYINERRRK